MSLDQLEPTDESPELKARKSRRRGVLEWIIVLIVAVTLSFLVRTFVAQEYFVPSGSMTPTLDIGDRILVNKLSVDFGTVNIGDIVVFKAPPAVKEVCDDDIADLVKRVIGVPGDTLYSRGNTIYVNGKPLAQKWTVYKAIGSVPIKRITLKKNMYFMMGDNHAGSCDSRSWGPVPHSDLIGKVFMKVWPLSHWHWY
ncbi:MAG: signal peptidase [Acidimicrobiaceae bacterium]|nr:signal peptidase [Acidimicrobiaceae bacterium]